MEISDMEMSSFAQTIMDRTYAHDLKDGSKETWDNIAYRVTKNVLKAVGIDMRQKFAQEMHRLISERKLIPAGRYLYASGRPYKQINNCLLLNAYDSREGWSELLAKASMSLMTGAGIGVSYSDIRCEGSKIRKTGGTASGPLSLMQIVNECGRGIMQGGARRSAIMASLRWDHPDIHKFIRIKNWSPEVRELKAKDYSFPATLDFTNISVQLNNEFFTAYHDDEHDKYAMAQSVYWAVIEQMLKTGEPGFSIDTDKNEDEVLRNAPLSGDTHVLTKTGYQQIHEIVNRPTTIWTGKRWAKNIVFKKTGSNVQTICVEITGGRKIKADSTHEFLVTRPQANRIIDRVSASELKKGDILSVQLPSFLASSPISVRNVTPGPVEDVFCCDVGYEEHTFVAEGVTVSNCGEVSSREDSDCCNLGSINLSRIENLDEFKHVIEYATAFLLAGSVYSDVPYSEVDRVRSKNRRLGLGLMGIHEWLLQRGKPYAPDEELGAWLAAYAKSGRYANKWADEWELSRPKKTRALAPNGCQHPETLIVTSNGILELQEISEDPQRIVPIKLKVAQEKDKYVKSSHLFRNGVVATKKIIMSSKIMLEATPNHKYRALIDGKYMWRRADKLKVGDLLVVVLGTYKKKTEPKLIAVRPYHVNEHSFKCPDKMSPDLARFLGIYFGDGSNHRKGIRIHCNKNDPKYTQSIADLGLKLFGLFATFSDNGRNCISVCFNSRRLLRWLYVNALDKQYSRLIEFPRLIRESSSVSLLEFINGFWLADGSQSKNTVYFDTASAKFATQLVSILRALGIEATESALHTSGKGTIMHRVYKVRTRRRCHTTAIQQQLEKLDLIPNFTVDKIISIEDSENDTLDLHVPGSKTYIANSFISHNTTSIIAETTGGIEPIFCVAYKRRYLKGTQYYYQYVIDPCAKRLIESGVDPDSIEDAYMLAQNVEKRVAFQAWIQGYVDHCISSTINLPAYGTELNNKDSIRPFGSMLMRHLPQLRGITVYPDGGRSGQPLSPVSYKEALEHEGTELVEEAVDICSLKGGGSCSD